MPSNLPKVSISVDRIGTDDASERVEFLVIMKRDGVEHAGSAVFDGKTDSPYARTIDWQELR